MPATQQPTTMTKMQVKKAMQAAGIVGQLTGRGANWEVELANEKTKNAFFRKVIRVGGFKTGCDSWVLRPGYQGNGDWNDRTSRWHY